MDKNGIRSLSTALCVLFMLASAVYISKKAISPGPSADHGLFYYATRLVFSGKNPYDKQALLAAWQQDGAPDDLTLTRTFSGYVNPPSFAFITSPLLLAPASRGHLAVNVLNLLATFACIAILMKMAAPSWSLRLRLLFAAGVLVMYPLNFLIFCGQSSMLVCVALFGGLYALTRKRNGLAGVLFGIALAKFTLVIPFVAFLAYRRNWKAFFAAVSVFFALNLALSAPVGVLSTIQSYRALVKVETRQDSSYDPMTHNPAYDQDGMIYAQKFFVNLGLSRSAVTAVNMIFFLISAAALAILLRRRGPSVEEGFIPEPLEISVLSLATLTLFYHRAYDLILIMPIAYGVIEHGIRQGYSRSWKWNLSLFVLLLPIWLPVQYYPRLEYALKVKLLPHAPMYYFCGYVLFLFIASVLLLWRDREKLADSHREISARQEPESPLKLVRH